MTETPIIFNRKAKQSQRNRHASSLGDYNFLFQETASRLLDRLPDIRREFHNALDMGCHGGDISENRDKNGPVKNIFQCDLSENMAARARKFAPAVAADEEFLPFKADCFDLVLSNFSLHWVNDLPGTLLQIRHMLKNDGLFLASMAGGETLYELRHALMTAELEYEGGASPRVSPFADVKDLGNLLTRAGFALPVADTEKITVHYKDPFRLLNDLRGMGESSALDMRRKTFMRRKTLLRAMEIYRETFENSDGTCPATFEVITLTAWKPDPSQQQPLKPGSASVDLADVLTSADQDTDI